MAALHRTLARPMNGSAGFARYCGYHHHPNPVAAFNTCNSCVTCWKTDLDNTYEA